VGRRTGLEDVQRTETVPLSGLEFQPQGNQEINRRKRGLKKQGGNKIRQEEDGKRKGKLCKIGERNWESKRNLPKKVKYENKQKAIKTKSTEQHALQNLTFAQLVKIFLAVNGVTRCMMVSVKNRNECSLYILLYFHHTHFNIILSSTYRS
jgi:hypothetical protein